ncbi:PREDICTED: endogenous retrovirus group K member 25 Pol protein-like [Corvus brachyrhynchos]|uniref:endogenous retrovirus group K member 25 Pol protein-like n=1 Tax=Corvus brachyrhynchos TaxID=85066 RepID=UPI0008163BF5|nr:PREDICTED: endogenous retrovirus group K member 25 Pol protein-like [Corvus brachyrhynchos]
MMALLPDIFEQAKISHWHFHQNAPALVRQFNLKHDQARAIVAACPECHQLALPAIGTGFNPRGLNSCEVWQMDVTHVASFGRMKYVHVSVDTFSGAVFASAHAGEKVSDARRHLVQAFATLGIPELIKTDNGPAYSSKEFRSFLQQWGIEHKTGIPYSPTGQAIVERAHQNIKRMLQCQRFPEKLDSPVIRLSRALFTLNFLNCAFENLNPPIVRHFGGSRHLQMKEKPPVWIKDLETREIQGPHELITWGKGYACVSTPEGPRWIPLRRVKPCVSRPAGKGSQATPKTGIG